MAMAVALSIVGCAPAAVDVPITYVPQTNVQQVRGAESVRIDVQIRDARTNKAEIGAFADPIHTSEITTNDNLTDTVKDAVQTELQNRGFKVGAGGPAIVIDINGLDVRHHVSLFGDKTARAVMMMHVRVIRKNGDTLYSQEAAGERGESNVWYYESVGSPKHFVNLAIQDCIRHLFADPKFIDALLNADNS